MFHPHVCIDYINAYTPPPLSEFFSSKKKTVFSCLPLVLHSQPIYMNWEFIIVMHVVTCFLGTASPSGKLLVLHELAYRPIYQGGHKLRCPFTSSHHHHFIVVLNIKYLFSSENARIAISWKR